MGKIGLRFGRIGAGGSGVGAHGARIVGDQSQAEIAAIAGEELFQKLGSRSDVLRRIEGIRDVQEFRRGRHQLHHTFGSFI